MSERIHVRIHAVFSVYMYLFARAVQEKLETNDKPNQTKPI